MKSKICGNCNKECKLWKAKRKLPDGTVEPGLCKECANKPKPSIVEPLIELIHEMDLAILKSNKPLQSTKKPKPISKVSTRMKDRLKLYYKVREDYLNGNIGCEAGFPGCIGIATDIHHKAGKTGNLLFDQKYFLAVCRICHWHIELNPKEAKQKGFSVDRLNK